MKAGFPNGSRRLRLESFAPGVSTFFILWKSIDAFFEKIQRDSIYDLGYTICQKGGCLHAKAKKVCKETHTR